MVFSFFAESFKIRNRQAGLLTYPFFSPFPPRFGRDSGLGRSILAGITATGTVQESTIWRFTCFPFDPQMRNLFGAKVNKRSKERF